MQVLHGTWVPAGGGCYVQRGRFLLWAERGCEQADEAGFRVEYLDADALLALLAGRLRLETADAGATRCRLRLPALADRPLPSPALARWLGVVPDPRAVRWRRLDVAAWELPQPLAGLDDLRFAVEREAGPPGAGDEGVSADDAGDDRDAGRLICLGEGLRFWLDVNHTLLKQILRRDQYVPALRYRSTTAADGERGAGRGQKGQKGQGVAGERQEAVPDSFVYPAWDLVAPDLDSRVQQAARRMPWACAAAGDAAEPARGADDPPAPLYDRPTLLRHYLAYQLTQAVTRIDYPQPLANRFNDSFIKACLRQDLSERVLRGDAAEEHFRQWRRWRRSLQPAPAAAARLGLELQAAPSDDASWRLQLLVESRRQPTLRLPLIEFWQLDDARRHALPIGDHPERTLLTELGLAARVYPPLWQTLNDRRPDALVLDTNQAFDFLKEAAWVLRDAGFSVTLPDWWKAGGRQRARLRLRAGESQPADGESADAGGGYFGAGQLVRFRYELALGDASITPDEWRRLVASKAPLVQFRGRWIELDPPSMGRLLEFWLKHGDAELEQPLTELLRQSAIDDAELDFGARPELAEALQNLQQPARLQRADDPPGLNGKLRDYQKRGLAWLGYLERLGLSGCLADDMGLGKTIQVIALLVAERQHAPPPDAPTLLIAPTSVVGNWRRELTTFAPALAVLLHHGSERAGAPAAFADACRRHQVVITSYALARRDAKLLGGVDWWRIVVDEAQNIKNPSSAQTRAILKLPARHRIALTGTPVENRLLDLWSIMQFLNPGYLGGKAQYRSRFEVPIQKHGRREPLEQLRALIRPFILRRLKTDTRIIQDLPDKIEQTQYCQLTPEQATLYAAVVAEVEATLAAGAGNGGEAGIRRKGVMLAALLRLKQICNHPWQYLQDDSPFDPARSHKLARLDELLGEALASGDSALVFTQFAELGAALARHLRRRHVCPVYYLHGGVAREQRERMVAAFQHPQARPGLFVLSLKAGGVGITLTRASRVFHFDRWWNPAVEEQATDRAFRIGQTQNVFVHKFVTTGTLEEHIEQMLRDKKQLADGAVGHSDESWLTELDDRQFRSLIALDRGAVA